MQLVQLASSLVLILVALAVSVNSYTVPIQTYIESYRKTRARTLIRSLYNLYQIPVSGLVRLKNTLLHKDLHGVYGGKVDYLIIYPVKAVSKGIKVTEWTADNYGLKHDRQYVLCSYDKENNSYKPQLLRFAPKLTTVDASIDGDRFKFVYDNIVTNEQSTFYLPMNVSDDYVRENSSLGSEMKKVQLWKSGLQGYVLDKVLSEDFIKSMNLLPDTVLIYSPAGKACKVGAPSNVDRKTLFHDYYPMLMCSQESFQYVKQSAGEKVDYVKMESFRPNLVICDIERPFEEDFYHKFDLVSKTGRMSFTGALKCIRCTIPNIDLAVGVPDKKATVSKTMAKYRRVDETNPYHSCFGMYVIQHQANFVIRQGDTIDLLRKKSLKMEENPFY
ncbi:hypothetical protein OGAPHI_000735 [Ogataea philodendri]|uniref:MOSC domain-containing protein n=1 Tax=Ogataea philodendri TaxID=1378263 RepID=A0A9P8PGV7_9ASCO|nr:uncharacterized protein OGAPHI_000735 [Ogataea philodendri]KAH3671024.1 hypothetical protein OGAPHI_000735 [Ogataea philodendri]